jgi:thiol-disulfide isomerase/thioredoxin
MPLFLLFLSGASALNFGPNVVNLGRTNFAKEVDKRDNTTVWFVMFHGPHCPHCQMAYPELISAANDASGLVRFGQVNTDEDGSFSNRFQLHGIPQFYIFHPKGQTQYQYARNARSFLNTAAGYIPNLALPINESWLNLTGKAVILFSDKKNPPPLWKGISCAFKNGSIAVGFCNNQSLQKQFGVVPVPTILFVDGGNPIAYGGQVKFAPIRQAVKEFIEGRYRQPPPAKTTAPPKLVRRMTQEGFKLCKGKGKFCVVAAEGIVEKEFESVAQRYRKDPFIFYVGSGKLGLLDVKDGIWILHHRRDHAVHVNGVEELALELQRVIDGTAKFAPVPSAAEDGEM